MERGTMRRMMFKWFWAQIFVILLSFSNAFVASTSVAGNIDLSYDIIAKDTSKTNHTIALAVRLKIRNTGESAIDKVTAHVAGTMGMAVNIDYIFFGIIESGDTVTSDSFDVVVERDDVEGAKPLGIMWEIRYWTRCGTGVVEKGWTYFQQEPDISALQDIERPASR
jgi:hypothetical protein